MAGQSEIQSLVQSLAGTQSQAQANPPSWVNNGNPNTVYNQTPPEGGYIPPTSDAFGNWMINKPDPNQVPATDWNSLVKEVQGPLKVEWDISQSVPQLPAAGQPQQPGQPNQPAAPAAPQYVPVGQWFGSGQKDGGKSGPLSNQQLYNSNPAAKEAWDRVFMMQNGKFDKTSDWAAIQRDLETFYREAINRGVPTAGNPNQAAATGGGGGSAGGGQAAAGGGGGSGTILGFGGAGGGIASASGASAGSNPSGGSWSFGSGGGNYGGASTLYNFSPAIAEKIGINPNGTIAWQQLADLVLPGNVYLSNTGNWDASNLATALLGQISGLPIDSIVNKLGELQAGQDDPQNFIERMLIDHYLDNVSNKLQGQLNISQNEFKNQIAPLLSQAIADSVNISSLDIQNEAVASLLDKAAKKEQEKVAAKTPQGGGGGGERGGNRGTGTNSGNRLSGVNVQYKSGAGALRAPRGPGSVTVGTIQNTVKK